MGSHVLGRAHVGGSLRFPKRTARGPCEMTTMDYVDIIAIVWFVGMVGFTALLLIG